MEIKRRNKAMPLSEGLKRQSDTSIITSLQPVNKVIKVEQGTVVPMHDIQAHGGVEVELHSFLNSAMDGDEWAASFIGLFTPERSAVGTH